MGKSATGYALRSFPRAFLPHRTAEKTRFKNSDLIHLSTAADSKRSDRSWVNIQSAEWVNIQPAPTNQPSAPAAPVPRPVVRSLVLAPAMPVPQPIGLPAPALTSAQAAAIPQQHQSNLVATYKCQKSGRTSYSDQPCSSGDGTLAVTTATKGTQRVIGDDLSQMKMQDAVSDSNPYTADSAIYRIEVPDPGSKRIGFGT